MLFYCRTIRDVSYRQASVVVAGSIILYFKSRMIGAEDVGRSFGNPENPVPPVTKVGLEVML